MTQTHFSARQVRLFMWIQHRASERTGFDDLRSATSQLPAAFEATDLGQAMTDDLRHRLPPRAGRLHRAPPAPRRPDVDRRASDSQGWGLSLAISRRLRSGSGDQWFAQSCRTDALVRRTFWMGLAVYPEHPAQINHSRYISPEIIVVISIFFRSASRIFTSTVPGETRST